MLVRLFKTFKFRLKIACAYRGSRPNDQDKRKYVEPGQSVLDGHEPIGQLVRQSVESANRSVKFDVSYAIREKLFQTQSVLPSLGQNSTGAVDLAKTVKTLLGSLFLTVRARKLVPIARLTSFKAERSFVSIRTTIFLTHFVPWSTGQLINSFVHICRRVTHQQSGPLLTGVLAQ